MQIIQGIPVSSGIVIGEAFIQEIEGFRIPLRFVESGALNAEIRRFQQAVNAAKEEIISNRESTHRALGKTFADIFEAQLQILLDKKSIGAIEELIREKCYSAEYAVSVVMGQHISIFQRMESSYIAEKINDIRDIEKRLLRLLLGARKELLADLTSPVVLLATNLTPSETANLDRRFIQAIVTESGGPGGHTAILAAALEIPCVVGTGPFLAGVSGSDTLIVDGNSGMVIIGPDEKTLQRYHRMIANDSTLVQNLSSYRNVDAVTTDGVHLEVNANIEFPHEAENCLQHGASGVGLFRTEFLYLTQLQDPTEEEHFFAIKRVLDVMKGKPVVIRTFDLGDDKKTERHTSEIEHNPALGLRGIRLSLKRWPMFRCQLRAILRASVYGDLRLMFPLVSTVKEFRQARRSCLNDVMEELADEKIPFNGNIPVGMMVEVPSAVITLDQFTDDADFFSIGTNDLLQYTMACDRGNRNVNHLFQAENPAVLRLIRRTVMIADRNKIPVSLCGQMGGNPFNVVLLLGLGLRSISCSPASIERIKQICCNVSIKDCQAIARKAIRYTDAKDVQDFVRMRVVKLMPQLFGREE